MPKESIHSNHHPTLPNRSSSMLRVFWCIIISGRNKLDLCASNTSLELGYKTPLLLASCNASQRSQPEIHMVLRQWGLCWQDINHRHVLQAWPSGCFQIQVFDDQLHSGHSFENVPCFLTIHFIQLCIQDKLSQVMQMTLVILSCNCFYTCWF